MNNITTNNLCIGIDLGTTNSVLATVNQKPNGDLVSKVINLPRAVDVFSSSGKIKPQIEKRPLLPSYVYYDEDNNYKPIVGDFAKRRFSVRPHLVAKSIKSHMGEQDTSNLGFAEEIPDKTPAAISSRILEHMLRTASKQFHHQITEAIITVPANFDSMMVKATRDAAEMAGIKVFNDDGSERPILLEEPKAVMYDLINQSVNGELSNCVIDFSEKKNVMVFDLGGGTLDITLHEIKRREDHPETIKVNDIATNRYTLLGGDNFDKALAEEMYKRFLDKYKSYPDVVQKLKNDKKSIMLQLVSFAEDLKKDLSMSNSDEMTTSDDSGWGWDDDVEDDNVFNVGGNVGSTGYSYDDTFTKEEIENVFQQFMGNNLKFDDYKRLDKLDVLTNTNNIIYPILDVLNKASKKLGVTDVKVDAVVLNGGMSRFYMIKDRLTELFGFEPIEAMDPDQAVARGAAIYHYYLKKDIEALSDDMIKVGSESIKKDITNEKLKFNNVSNVDSIQPKPTSIEWGKNILNDSLYLGNANGNQTEIISTGTELPYSSELMKGFQLLPNKTVARIDIPIRVKAGMKNDEYRTIASGTINFKKKYPNGAYVVLKVDMSASKIITMRAWTCEDIEGTQIIEEGSTDISISNDTKRQKNKLLSPQGSPLKAQPALDVLKDYCQKFEKSNTKSKSIIAAKIKAHIAQIYTASNPEDFAEPLLRSISFSFCEEYICRCLIIARKIGVYWQEKERTRLAQICINILSPELQGIDLRGFVRGPVINTRIQAIYALSMCGNEKDIKIIQKLRGKHTYLNASLYTLGKRHFDIDWLLEQLEKDCIALHDHREYRNLQNSAHAIGIAFNNYPTNNDNLLEKRNNSAKLLQQALKENDISGTETVCCILALGCICDQRYENSMDNKVLNETAETLRSIENYAYPEDLNACMKARDIAYKMLEGLELNETEEQFLLKKLDMLDK
ncbi:Hsp70 family protein [Megamonas hypermegale]|uniref:Hsp70 family protein n=1 Tax=Megamonas hypermegale TaxID=158847 RepID=UPI00255CA1FD|nr:Hsp70 family protein [Megamonas hypermegale]